VVQVWHNSEKNLVKFQIL